MRLVRAFAELIELSAAGEHEQRAPHDSDPLEVALHSLFAEEEMFGENSAAIVELPNLSHLVALGEQASVLGQRQAGDFAERGGQNPSGERFSSERRVVIIERLLESLFARNGRGTALDLRQIERDTAGQRGEGS